MWGYVDLRVVRMALQAGMRVEEHQAEGRISVQTITGHSRMRTSGRTFGLPARSLLTLDRATVHDVEALEESAFMLTIAWPERIKDPQRGR